MFHVVLTTVFWFSFFLLAYTYLLYPCLMYVLARVRSACCSASGSGNNEDWPTVTVVIAACDAADLIVGRIQDLLAADYPPDKLDIVVVSDGSRDDTVVKACSVDKNRVRVLANSRHEGKMASLNLGIPVARGEIVILTDSRQRFDSAAIRILVEHFRDPLVGAVSGNLDIARSGSGTGTGVDAYWRLERFIRHQESVFASAVGCTGAIYAIRKGLFKPLPGDTILDDVVIPMHIITQGYRVLFEPAARAWDPQPLSAESERRRKRRTIAGNVQMLMANPSWLFPWKNRLWWQLISHKYLRLLGPFLLLAIGIANIFLAPQYPIYATALLCQGFCYALAMVGILFPRINWRPVALCTAFVFLNARVVPGIIGYVRGDYRQGWAK